MKTSIIIIIVGATIAGTLILGARNGGDASGGQAAAVPNVRMEDGIQIVEIKARGGYTPRRSQAQAGVETIIRMRTDNTFDCSLSLVVPGAGYRGILPRTGSTDIPIGVQKPGTSYDGLCSMGMYRFAIDFI